MAAPSIKDVVFERQDVGGRSRLWMALGLAVILHGSVWLWAEHSERSLESWSADLAARVHAELGHEEYVELQPPPPPAPPPATSPAAASRPRPALRPPSPVRRDRPAPRTPPPPAQTGQVVARAVTPEAPADLTGETFVTGTASAYAGGASTSNGTNTVAVQARTLDPHARPGSGQEPDQSSAVSLEGQDWSCAWPREADAEQIDEQTVVIRVRVNAQGGAESARVVRDPGHGFGSSAVACALRTPFTPAHDSRGKPIAAESPPIRVRFTR